MDNTEVRLLATVSANNSFTYAHSLFGGLFIGTAVGLTWFLIGKVCGNSGILGTLIKCQSTDIYDAISRVAFLLGMVLMGITLSFYDQAGFTNDLPYPFWQYIIAGLLVGFGTSMGNGCTSGHGLVGIVCLFYIYYLFI
eukprot:GHVR01124549.1.p1 GENE.GHVR01124549.1~~GHVR01124549.1.p1  ORF type:complete len:139 (+),score=22.00 GHVR01124549.1:41-457(+)